MERIVPEGMRARPNRCLADARDRCISWRLRRVNRPVFTDESDVASSDAGIARTLRLRLLPFLFVGFVIAFLDRVNVGFAALTMNPDLRITSREFGFAAGVFFLGYVLFEIPSNLLLHRFGARTWIARILITWGGVATLTGFVESAQGLYLARFVLGLAEAGFVPGVILYLGYWFCERDRAFANALFMTAIPVASILGGPASGLILDRVHWWGLSSWRWLLILEGMPAVFAGLVAYLLLPNGPKDASFLSPDERERLVGVLEREDQDRNRSRSAIAGLTEGRLWFLAAIGFAHGFGGYTFTFFLPQTLAGLWRGSSNSLVGLLIVIPNLLGLSGMVLVSRSSDRTLERRGHLAIPVALAGLALLSLSLTRSPWLSTALLGVVAFGVYSFLPVFFALPGERLAGPAAASGIALVTSVANLGGFAGPIVAGVLRERAGSLYPGLG